MRLLVENQHVTLAVVGWSPQYAAAAIPVQREPETWAARRWTMAVAISCAHNIPRAPGRPIFIAASEQPEDQVL